MRKCPSFASLRYERCRILGVRCFFRTALMGALHDGFCSLARKGGFVCRECTSSFSARWILVADKESRAFCVGSVL